MNNIQFTSRRTDFKILKVVAVLGISALAGFVLALLYEGIYPEPFVPIGFAVFFWEAIVSVPLALFVWCSFLLIRPGRYSRKWVIVEWIVVPLVWLLLVLAFDAWVHHLWLPLQRPDMLT